MPFLACRTQSVQAMLGDLNQATPSIRRVGQASHQTLPIKRDDLPARRRNVDSCGIRQRGDPQRAACLKLGEQQIPGADEPFCHRLVRYCRLGPPEEKTESMDWA